MLDVTPLVSIDEAKRHLRANGVSADEEADVQAKLDIATSVVVGWSGSLADADWDESTVPPAVHQTILMLLTELFDDRGDDHSRERPFGHAARLFLMSAGYYDPVVA